MMTQQYSQGHGVRADAANTINRLKLKIVDSLLAYIINREAIKRWSLLTLTVNR